MFAQNIQSQTKIFEDNRTLHIKTLRFTEVFEYFHVQVQQEHWTMLWEVVKKKKTRLQYHEVKDALPKSGRKLYSHLITFCNCGELKSISEYVTHVSNHNVNGFQHAISQKQESETIKSSPTQTGWKKTVQNTAFRQHHISLLTLILSFFFSSDNWVLWITILKLHLPLIENYFPDRPFK